MLSKIEITLNDSGQFVVVAGTDIVCTYSLREALQYTNYYAKFLAFFPNGNRNCPYANPIPFEEFVKQMKKEDKKKKQLETIKTETFIGTDEEEHF